MAHPTRAARSTRTAGTSPRAPQALKPGDAVSFVAPAFPFDRDSFNAGLLYCKNTLKLKPVFNKDIFSKVGLFSGTEKRRTDELSRAIISKNTKAVFAVRGGYGSALILEQLRKDLRKAKSKLTPKIVLGYSDLTLVLNMLYEELGWVTFHGPMVAGRAFHKPLPIERKTFTQALFKGHALGEISTKAMSSLHPGSAHAPLVGGCLALVCSSLGTSYEIQTANRILFLEDVGEAPYRLHRMLTQLRHAGKLDKVKAIVFGELAHCEPHTPAFKHVSAHAAIADALKGLRIPIVLDFPAGHGSVQCTIPIGQNVTVLAPSNKSRPTVLFEENPTVQKP